MLNWLHHLFNPHCADCYAEAQENKICQSCETLKSEITALRHNNQELLKAILSPKEVIIEKVTEQPQPIKGAGIPWRVRQQMLQNEDRERARLEHDKRLEMAEGKKTTEQLEKELLGDEITSEAS